MKKNYNRAPQAIITRDVNEIQIPTGNLYKSLVIVSKRSRQISSTIKEELTAKLLEFAPNDDNLEEVFENSEQIEISKYYERIPKPTQLALEEFLDEELYYRDKNEDELPEKKSALKLDNIDRIDRLDEK